MRVFDQAIVSPAQDQQGKTARGDNVAVIARAEQTNGMVGIWRNVIAPGNGPDWHMHSREIEVFRVLAGTFRFWCGADVFDLEQGATIVLPPNVPHQWKNIGSSPGELFAFVTPGGFERNFLDLAALGRVATVAEATAIENRLGVTGP
jgi:mannose-6-phosphate isomerase-like protein (cupin superfamily)